MPPADNGWGRRLTVPQLKLIHDQLAEGTPQEAAMLALYALGEPREVSTSRDGYSVLRKLFNDMYDAGNSLGCSALILPEILFNPNPHNVGKLLKAVEDRNQLLVMGSASQSKTYSLVVAFYIAWLRDPEWTSVKLMSQTENHLETNVWPHLLEIHKQNVLKPDKPTKTLDASLWMGIEGTPMSYGFNGIAFKQSTSSTGAFSGFKPQPKRPKSDPNFAHFGPMTRLRVLMDEAQQIPGGVWNDLNSIMGSISGNRVKIAAAFNPVSMDKAVVVLAEPPEGWNLDQMETLYSYESKHGWWVERLDAAKCENVIERREIYPGLMTYERFLGYLKGGGDNSQSYCCFARGFPALQDAANTVIPPDWVSSQRGEAIYIGPVTNVASEDLAYQGQDKAIMVIGRWGLASGWRDQSGKVHHFMDRLNPGRYKHRHVLTIDQFFPLSKQLDPVGITQEIMGKAKMLGIKPENTSCDQTGNALATYSYMAKYWGNVLGINWAHGATDSKILTDDIDTCKNRFDGIPSEMWFAFKEWLNPAVNAVLFNPTIQSADIYTELTSRRFQTSRGNRLKVEGKDIYKARNGGRSPDHADVVIQLVHLIRMRMGVTPGVAEEQGGRKREKGKEVPVKPIAHSFKRDLPDTEGELEVAGSGAAELEGMGQAE